MPFELPSLPYAYDALAPIIDEQTMRLHHDKHHQAYVTKLNEALESAPELQDKTVEELVSDLGAIPEAIRTPVRNQGGGHANHSLFWQTMQPGGATKPAGALAEAIEATFGGLEALQQQFNEAGVKQFGSGWVWLVKNASGALQVLATPNQDSPLSQGLIPLLGNDVWEHAYYLHYQNRRPDYLAAWWGLVNWDEVAKRFS